MKWTKALVAGAVLAGTASLAVPYIGQAGPTNSCSSGQMCVSRNTGGAGEQYEFASNDSALNNNDYFSGLQVSDHNLSTRNRNASFQRACVYQDFSYTGANVGDAPWSGAGWTTNDNELGSSIRWENSACD